jgi:hypothetical protein
MRQLFGGIPYANWIKNHIVSSIRPRDGYTLRQDGADTNRIAVCWRGFIPTDTVRQALTRRWICPTRSCSPDARDATVSLIASQQANLDSIIRRP